MNGSEEQVALQEFVDSVQVLVQSKLDEGIEREAIAYALAYITATFSVLTHEHSAEGFSVLFDAMSTAINEAARVFELTADAALH